LEKSAPVEEQNDHVAEPSIEAPDGEVLDSGNVIPLSERFNEDSEDIRYSRSAVRTDGIDVFITSDDVLNMSRPDRMKQYTRIMSDLFRGRTARFEKGGKYYYATFDEDDLRKPMYGEKRSSAGGRDAALRVGADGNIFDLVEDARYDYSKMETGKPGKAHTGVSLWDYYVKTVQIDDDVFDLVVDVKQKNDGNYVYSLKLNENKKIGAAPTENAKAFLRGGRNRAYVPIIDQNGNIVNGYEQKNTSEVEKILDGAGIKRFSRSLTPEQRKLREAERRAERLKEDNEFLRRLMESGRKAALSPRSVERIAREVSDLYGLGRDERIRTALGIVDKLYNGKVTGQEREDAEKISCQKQPHPHISVRMRLFFGSSLFRNDAALVKFLQDQLNQPDTEEAEQHAEHQSAENVGGIMYVEIQPRQRNEDAEHQRRDADAAVADHQYRRALKTGQRMAGREGIVAQRGNEQLDRRIEIVRADARHQRLEGQIPDQKSQRQRHTHHQTGAPRFFEAEKENGDGDPEDSAVAEFRDDREENVQKGAAERILDKIKNPQFKQIHRQSPPQSKDQWLKRS